MDMIDKNFSQKRRGLHSRLVEVVAEQKIIEKMFGDIEKISTFAPSEPAKPLNDAQIGGSFIYIGWRSAV